MPIDRIVKFFSSLRLTVVLLALGVLVVFFGTLAQTEEGLYAAQNHWFRSFVVTDAHIGWLNIPVFPGGYLIGSLLLVNLIAAHVTRFELKPKKLGLFLIHLGIILLLVGQLATDMLSTESHMVITEGESKSYSENGSLTELVFVSDADDPQKENVVSVAEPMLAKRREISDPRLPCTIRVLRYARNSRLAERPPVVATEPPASNQGIGTHALLSEVAPTTKMDERNLPSAVIELATPQGTIGSWLVSSMLDELQPVTIAGKTYRIGLRWMRYYRPFSVALLKFSHDLYRGTDKPKNFSSRVRVEREDNKETREVLIYMNNPLRYGGETFYQSSFDETGPVPATILQVVRNPGWLTPYLACILVFLGLSVQFLMHLFGFAAKRRTA